ncbi:cobalt-precorrin-6X reductase [Shinella sp. SUS2]|uniref:cobalt-precorrin-6A reductase n=1 Tax=unclassified Shinella TaxID=2643062 RepID=UPI00068175B2|nr:MULTISPECIES: cobalt-precorrin-6A reductase [unclassified Shinella]KNY14927.1 cobalt-precorrin-6X reductase [Shinella sp. SUS2]KOC74579.1 cobalt-precorrin-6X reductase [Shinella sp. GWS1]
MDKRRILILGGTAEARNLAGVLADRTDLAVTLSLAGRTLDPAPQPVPVRTGGFGGVEGLSAHLRDEAIDLLIDATHPFARQISANARAASAATGIPLLRLERLGWDMVEGDRWTRVANMTEAVGALGKVPRRVFLAIGRQEAKAFDAAPQHHYLVRSVDPVDPTLVAPDVDYLLARGPFTVDAEVELLRGHRIDVVVSKNSGGDATYGKIVAARSLGLPVVLVDRAEAQDGHHAGTVQDAVRLADHLIGSSRKRGV